MSCSYSSFPVKVFTFLTFWSRFQAMIFILRKTNHRKKKKSIFWIALTHINQVFCFFEYKKLSSTFSGIVCKNEEEEVGSCVSQISSVSLSVCFCILPALPNMSPLTNFYYLSLCCRLATQLLHTCLAFVQLAAVCLHLHKSPCSQYLPVPLTNHDLREGYPVFFLPHLSQSTELGGNTKGHSSSLSWQG